MSGLAAQWATAANREKFAIDSNLIENMIAVVKPTSFLLSLTSRDGRQMYASIHSNGQLLLWDVKLKRELSSSMLGSTNLTAVNTWRTPNQIIVASVSKGTTILKIFEEHVPVGELKLDDTGNVTKLRKSSISTRRQSGAPSSPSTRASRVDRNDGDDDAKPLAPRTARVPLVRAVFHVHASIAIVLLEPVDAEHGPTAKLVDMEDGQTQDVDVYGNGPPAFKEEDSDGNEENQEEQVKPILQQAKVDKLIQARIVEQQIKGRSQRILVCLYDSNRIVQCTLYDNETHEVMLFEEGAGERQRGDCPICFATLPNPNSNETYHLVVSYQSMMIRWWQVSLTAGKILAQVTLNAAVTHLTVFDWPSPTGQSANISPVVEKPAGSPAGPRRGNARFSVFSREKGNENAVRQSVRLVTEDPEHQASEKSAPTSPNARASLAHLQGGLNGFIRQRASVKNSIGHPRASVESREASKRQPGLRQSMTDVTSPHDDFVVNKDQSCLCIVGFDVAGGMPILLSRLGKMARVYICNDHFVDKSAKVDQLACDGSTIAVQISNGDIRHMEFVYEDEVIPLKDIPMDLP